MAQMKDDTLHIPLEFMALSLQVLLVAMFLLDAIFDGYLIPFVYSCTTSNEFVITNNWSGSPMSPLNKSSHIITRLRRS